MAYKKHRWIVPAGQNPTPLDEKVLAFQKKGKLIPNRDLIRTPEEIDGIRKAGVLNTAVLDIVQEKIKAGISTLEIDNLVAEFTEKNGGICAPFNYEGFPKHCCTSINDCVCHGIPKADDILEDGDIINVDVTTILNGYYADANRTFIVGGETAPSWEKLVRVTKECLEAGIAAAQPWHFINDIGDAIQTICDKHHYGIVQDLCGHGVGLKFHEEPEVCHYRQKKEGMLIVPGMVFTIEPMINMGTYKVFIDADDPYGWEVYTEDGKPSAQWEKTILITEDGVEVITE
ncbi:MAG: type I methionyl aminopeptidase [Bacteroidaceae bacterium]|nr:type I methionyl aminopeptidase [Bacteroidaceae bacterium]